MWEFKNASHSHELMVLTWKKATFFSKFGCYWWTSRSEGFHKTSHNRKYERKNITYQNFSTITLIITCITTENTKKENISHRISGTLLFKFKVTFAIPDLQPDFTAHRAHMSKCGEKKVLCRKSWNFIITIEINVNEYSK